MATTASIWMEHLIVSILLILITIASFLVLYQLFSSLYCIKSTSPKPHQKQLPQVRSNTPGSPASASSVSSDNHTNNELSHSGSPNQDETEPQPIHRFFKNNTIAICISFSIICIACALDRITLMFNHDRKNRPPGENDPWLSLIFPFYFIGRILLSLIFIGRLHYTFHGSIFE
eukprot:328938_1